MPEWDAQASSPAALRIVTQFLAARPPPIGRSDHTGDGGVIVRHGDEFHGELRRTFPGPRRRPNPFVVAHRWRYELVVAVGLAICVRSFGGPLTVSVAGAIGVAVFAAGATWPTVRAVLVQLVQHVVVPHRLRTGFVQAGTVSREGRLPWVTRTRGRTPNVVTVHLWLPAGITPEDLYAARRVLAAACGAFEVQVQLDSPRRDRCVVSVVRPRWGMPGW